MGATDSLKAAYSKAASLPAREQDEIARLIVDRVEGGIPILPEFSRIAAIGRVVDLILPKNPVARTITLYLCCFTLFVMAPAALISLVGTFMLR